MPALLAPKTRRNIALDVAMAVLFLVLMNISWTGILLHELIGAAITALLAVHLLINRRWIGSIARRLFQKTGARAKALFLLNAFLGLSMALTLLSGILISEYIFAPLAAANADRWVNIHTAASYLSLVIAAIHTVVHWRWITGVISRLKPTGGDLRPLCARAVIGLLAIVTAYSLLTGRSFEGLLQAAENSDPADTSGAGQSAGTSSTDSQATLVQSTDGTVSTDLTLIPTTTEPLVEPAITLYEYLSKLRCTACHKHCLLTSPKCSRGDRQIEQATEEYNEIYAQY